MTTLSNLGSELVAASKKVERTPGEILQEIFPWVFEASRRMSARQISAWLKEQRGIEISQPTISRALRSPKGFWDGFAETIEPTARRIASSVGASMKDLLLDDGNDASYDFHLAYQKAKRELSKEEIQEVEEGLEFLRENWFSLSVGTRRACAPSFACEDDEEIYAGE
jgi:hypothetical protein